MKVVVFLLCALFVLVVFKIVLNIICFFVACVLDPSNGIQESFFVFFKIKVKVVRVKTGFGGLLPDQEKCPSTAFIQKEQGLKTHRKDSGGEAVRG